MSNFVTHDLPIESAEGEEPLLIDANAGFYEAQPRCKSYVFVERYVQKKTFFEPLPEGTESSIRPETYLIKTTNYQDIGGGLIMFDRHYARIPLDWFDFQVVSVTTAVDKGLLDATYIVNPFSGSGRNTSVLAKATRRYYLESNLPTDLVINIPQFSQIGTVTGSIDFPSITVREDDVSIYQGNIYQVTSFNATVVVVST
jgi:hypothetical protein